ncbi:hypothetical protein BO70DRAFT_106827 [Aspergillus heteromorphus CBS 117.55]|uniref:Uncharacterized protein n=1 Tax=Aspergillus heteromorphus CBS 117.55 TaxID=1448321 RepID=A0A317VR94_9EURO|nr:uncharacterized protein BO70DRAFT_106827 [Aspergillus heteromorphus CBS 117.55]PWY74430.1 hypothetical protein BO70DRAFT_106827 [Aspergillus heteromorphus CBS 117.55]
MTHRAYYFHDDDMITSSVFLRAMNESMRLGDEPIRLGGLGYVLRTLFTLLCIINTVAAIGFSGFGFGFRA